MRFDSILKMVATAASELSAVGVPGAGLASTVLKGAQGLADAFDHLKAANGGTAPPEAQEVRDTKLAGVLAHARSVADELDPDGA